MASRNLRRITSWVDRVACFISIISTACGGSDTQAVREVPGVYALVQVDGVALPVPLQAGTSDGSVCPSYTTDGRLNLAPDFSSQPPPTYEIVVFGGPTCDRNRPADPATASPWESGGWTVSGDEIEFTSVSGVLRSGTLLNNVQGQYVDLSVGGHAYKFRFAEPIFNDYGVVYGTVAVSAVDGAGNLIPGVRLTFIDPDGLVDREPTTSGGFSPRAGIAGKVRVWFTPPTGYIAAQGQANPFDMTCVANQITFAVIQLVRS